MKNTLKITVSAALAAAALAATAMPTKRQLAEAQKLVNDLTADDIRSFNAKQKTASEVAAKHLDLAAKADTEADKYLLLQGAFRIYAHGGNYDAAADVLLRMKKDISDVPPELMVELVDGEMRRVAYSKAPKVHAIYNEAKRTIKYRKLLAAAEIDVKKRPTSKTLKQLAECHVHLGNWKKALETFARARVPAARWELDPDSVSDCDALKAAEYWWRYEAEETKPFRAHAAALYRIALDNGLVTGLRSEVVKKRISDMGLPIVNGWVIPGNFSPPLEKSLKLAGRVEMTFCACPPGSFRMATAVPGIGQRSHKVNITRPFWTAKTFLTVQQFSAFRSDEKIDKALAKLEQAFPGEPVFECFRYNDVMEFISWLNEKYGASLPKGYVFRMATEAELRYTARGRWYFNSNVLLNPDVLKGKKLDANELKGMQIWEQSSLRPGPWGVCGTIPNGLLKFTSDSVDSTSDLNYDNEETDPIRIGKIIVTHGYDHTTHLHARERVDTLSGFARIVVAPDHITEKKVKEKK